MEFWIAVMVGVVMFLFGVLVGRIKTKKREEALRRGVAKMRLVGSGLMNRGENYSATVIVEELERMGHLSRIRIVDIAGVDKDIRSQVSEIIGKYIPTSEITWLEEKQ